jgi:hypothetical protein
MYEGILTTGITDLNSYPKIKCTNYCKQTLETDLLTIPCEKPVVESINEVRVDICIENFHIINTVLGPKIILNCLKNIKVVYTANNCEQSLHSSHWKIPFCDFILLKDISYDDCLSLIKNVFIGIEHICINNCSDKLIDLSVLFVICPIIKEQYCLNSNYNNKKQNYSSCDQYGKYSKKY